MPSDTSRDEFYAQKAVEFADQLQKVAALADKEEEIRIAVERQLAFIEKEAGIEWHGKHEFRLAKGQADSVYSRVIIEYKNPSDPGDRIGPKADSPGSKKVVKQIKDRFQALNAEHGHALGNLFGVGLDGRHFIFVRYRDNKWDVQEPVEVNRYSAERFLWALVNLGQKGKPFSPDYLAGDFGANENSIAVPGVHALYEAIVATENPKARTFFNQWKILFGLSTGELGTRWTEWHRAGQSPTCFAAPAACRWASGTPVSSWYAASTTMRSPFGHTTPTWERTLSSRTSLRTPTCRTQPLSSVAPLVRASRRLGCGTQVTSAILLSAASHG